MKDKIKEPDDFVFTNGTQYLNESQLRRLSTVLATLEEDLLKIEVLLEGEAYTGAVFRLINNITPEVRDTIRHRIGKLREIIRTTAERFHLETNTKSSARQISAILSSCGVSIEECKSSYLHGYGHVAHDLTNVLDPELDLIIGLMWEIQNIIGEQGNI